MTWGGMWELMELQAASPLFWRSQTGHHGEPALSQHGCTLQLLSAWPQQPLGHSSVSLSHHCPRAVFQGQPWWSVPPGRLQTNPQTSPPRAGGPSFLLASPTVPPWFLSLPRLLLLPGQSCQAGDRQAGSWSAVPASQGHQHRHTPVTSPTLQSHFPAASGTQQEPGIEVSPTRVTLSTSPWATRLFPCSTASCPHS